MTITQRHIDEPEMPRPGSGLALMVALVLVGVTFLGIGIAQAAQGYVPPTECVSGNPWYGPPIPTTIGDPYVTVDPQLYACTHYPAPTTTLPVNPNLTVIPTTTIPSAPLTVSPPTTPQVTGDPVGASSATVTGASQETSQETSGAPIATVKVPGAQQCTGALSVGSYSVDCTNSPFGVCPASGDLSTWQNTKDFRDGSSASAFQDDYCGLAQSGYCWAPPIMTYPGEPTQVGNDYAQEQCS